MQPPNNYLESGCTVRDQYTRFNFNQRLQPSNLVALNVSHVTFCCQKVYQDSYGQGEVEAVYYLTRVVYPILKLAREKMSEVSWPNPPPVPSENRQSHFQTGCYLLPPFSSSQAHPALLKEFTLHLIPGHDELNIPGDIFWCLNLVDHLPLFYSETQSSSVFSWRLGCCILHKSDLC